MSTPAALPALPGASADPGSGPVEAALLDALLDDRGPLAAHRELLSGEHRDLLATLVIPAVGDAARSLAGGLLHGHAEIRILLDAATLDELRHARTQLLGVDGVEIVAVRLAVAGGDDLDLDAERATRELLAELDSSVPAWITVPAGPAAAAALDVLAADGAENVTVDVSGLTASAAAGVLRLLVDRDLSFRVAAAPGVLGPDGADAPGALNLLCATRAALNGAEPAELAAILAAREVGPLASALRRMSAADAAVVRAFLVAVEVPDAAAAVADLDRLGLLPSASLP